MRENKEGKEKGKINKQVKQTNKKFQIYKQGDIVY
jgi:hypothetical protein